ncbi:MAG: hypothetical protein MUP92_00620 [Actinobacteria bacterium]|nr:hypothetical protein [Actinomycetota bacterium]
MSSLRAFRSISIALLAAATLLALALGQVAGATDTAAELDRARADLKQLEDQLSFEREEVDQVAVQLEAVKEEVVQTEERYRELEALLNRTDDQAQAAATEYEEVRQRLNSIIAEAYMGGTAQMVSFLMDAGSQVDLSARLDLLSAIAIANATLADRATQLASDLQERSDQISVVTRDKEAVLESLNRQKEDLKIASQNHDEAVAKMERTRVDLFDLVDQLKKDLRLEDIQYLQQTFRGEKSLPYGQWAGVFLNEMGAPTCLDNLVAVVAWQLNEGTSADWNPLATTYYLPGSSAFNSSGVRNYASLASGLEATRLTLQEGSSTYLYQPIISSLRDCADAMTTAKAINRSSWCRGCTYGMYVTGLVDRVKADYDFYSKL